MGCHLCLVRAIQHSLSPNHAVSRDPLRSPEGPRDKATPGTRSPPSSPPYLVLDFLFLEQPRNRLQPILPHLCKELSLGRHIFPALCIPRTIHDVDVLAFHRLAVFQDRPAALGAEFAVKEGAGAVVGFVDLGFERRGDAEARGGEFGGGAVRSPEEFLMETGCEQGGTESISWVMAGESHGQTVYHLLTLQLPQWQIDVRAFAGSSISPWNVISLQ